MKKFLIALALFFVLLFLVLPLLVVFYSAFSKGWAVFAAAVMEPDTRHALYLTLLVTAITVPVNVVFGIAFAWLVTRFRFRGRAFLITLLDIPFAVSPVIAGLLYLLLYGANNSLGTWFIGHGMQLMFAVPGIVMVTVFVTCPFVARELIPFMQQHGAAEEEAAVVLGASAWQLWRKITLPSILWPLLYGVALTNARAVGEFGAVSVVSGNIRGETNTLSLNVELLYQDYQAAAAFASAVLLVFIALTTLALKSWATRHKEGL
ncbi:MAG: sulfate ABC transporter permease subunit CysW [Cardiobacteriaceae bacterium]|nr:sulfate ABC transporter permease subunit CysW [Cardiobacteriaceae bacterium]